jgi:hypothetical protein
MLHKKIFVLRSFENLNAHTSLCKVFDISTKTAYKLKQCFLNYGYQGITELTLNAKSKFNPSLAASTWKLVFSNT